MDLSISIPSNIWKAINLDNRTRNLLEEPVEPQVSDFAGNRIVNGYGDLRNAEKEAYNSAQSSWKERGRAYNREYKEVKESIRSSTTIFQKIIDKGFTEANLSPKGSIF